MMKLPDIQLLLLPITKELPCGEDYAFSAEFDAIRKAREYDDPYMAQGEWSTQIKVADWEQVIESAERLLQFNTKDIRVTTWLMEGWAYKFGYLGLKQAFDLLRLLCERYWDNLNPLSSDSGDQELRIGAFIHFVTSLVMIIRQIPITETAGQIYTCADYDSAHHFEIMAKKDPNIRSEISEHKVTLAKFSAAQQKTSKSFYVSLKNDFEQAQSSWEQLAQCLDSKLASDGPAFGPVQEAFELASRVIQHLSKDAGLVSDSEQPILDHKSELITKSENANVNFGESCKLNTRDEALQQLESVAEFFRKTEPHSPVAYLASKAVNWGNMPLHEWLRVVLKDEGSLSYVEELLGIHTTESK